MPIYLNENDWSETEATIRISLRIPGVRTENLHLTQTDVYLKVSCPPYIYEILLEDKVGWRGRRNIYQGELEIILDKLERRKWGRPGTKVGKKEVEDVRRREEEKLRLFLNNQDKARIEERGEREKKCVGLTMEKEEGRREEIERRKVVAIAEVMHDEKDGRRRRNKYDLDFAGRIAHEREMDKEIAMVPPRTGGVIQVNLSKRTRLPARESRKAEEEEWMKKMEEGKLREGKEREDKEVDKTEILTFKQFNQKAVNFIQCGDLRSAESILTEGCEQFPSNLELVSNRTLVYLLLEEWEKCLQDSNLAISLLNPPVDENKERRVKILCRRAKALVALGRPEEGLQDLNLAHTILPLNSQIQTDRDNLKKMII
ncbi:dynein assembly factor 4, axonemal [Eurytemora carolleeae]|uniref:dynein assembly factor 4, axonemal n=1 Tax=Eurytemora carolleeae TaxID=1294199 RepID=UPI000C782B0E|nr:dynein assembly factor 4, axonemal [Eurytemora carolleeae]|eukprot:XP_023339982.1 dynein assembly factor 4, axonemal-like [Eurytemora affinis]